MSIDSKILLKSITLALIIALPNSLHCASNEDAQEQMGILKRSIKQFQYKLSRYQRCIKEKCSDQEKAEVKKELISIGKKVAITAGVVLVLVLASSTAYMEHKRHTSGPNRALHILDKLQQQKLTDDDREALEEIFKKEALDPDDIMISGQKALFAAVKQSDADTVQLLLDKDSDPNQRTMGMRGKHVLYDALLVLDNRKKANEPVNAAETIIEVLLKKGADPTQSATFPLGVSLRINETTQVLNLTAKIENLLKPKKEI